MPLLFIGNVYIADTHNHRVRKVYIPPLDAGEITTIAGIGSNSSSSDNKTDLAVKTSVSSPYSIELDAVSDNCLDAGLPGDRIFQPQ